MKDRECDRCDGKREPEVALKTNVTIFQLHQQGVSGEETMRMSEPVQILQASTLRRKSVMRMGNGIALTRGIVSMSR